MNTFNWRDYFILAKVLARKQNEASLRSAVSRAYYAVFCTARNHAVTQGFVSTNTGRDHRLVQEFYYQRLSAKVMASNLNRLFSYRKLCDYEDYISNPQLTTQLALLLAKGILQTLP